MAYDDPPGHHRYGGHEGFRDEPDFRAGQPFAPGGYDAAAGYPASEPTATPVAPIGSAGMGGYDTDRDLDGADPGRDRLAVHWVWEALLLVTVGVLSFLVWQAGSELLRGDNLARLLVLMTGFGLLGLAAGVSMRAGVPNLAIGPVAAASGAYFAIRGDEGVATPTIFALGVAVLVALGVAALVTIFQVPAWAATLAAGAAAVVWLQTQSAVIPFDDSFYDPRPQAAFLFAVVAGLGILGGLLGTLAPVRAALGRFRPVADPAGRRGGGAAVAATGALVLSMMFATIAGVLLVAGARVDVEGGQGVSWFTWTVIGFGVALVGGTSAFGRRGGVFGTILAVVALVLFHTYQQTQDWKIALLATAGAAVAGGLVVTRLMEWLGRPGADRAPRADRLAADDQWASASASAPGLPPEIPTQGWPQGAADSWSATLPARPVPGTPDPWQDDRWRR